MPVVVAIATSGDAWKRAQLKKVKQLHKRLAKVPRTVSRKRNYYNALEAALKEVAPLREWLLEELHKEVKP